MKLSSRRSRAIGAVIASCGAIAAVVGSGAGLATAAAPAARPVVLVNCGKAEVKPAGYVLACADAGAYLTRLHWVSWQAVAFGNGIEFLNSCVPDCAANHFYSYPVLITVWRAEPRPGHQGQQYFSRMTVIHTGKLTRPHETLPLTQTFDLFPSL
jgi:hypothetical protein